MNEEEQPINLIVAFYDENSMKLINFIEGINRTSNSFEITSSEDPTFGIVANYRNFTTGIIWNYCKSEAKSGLKAPQVLLLMKSSNKLMVMFQNFYCAHKASADFYEITYCNDESCLKKNVTNKDLITGEFALSGLKEFTNYNVSVRIYNTFVGYGKSSKIAHCRTGEGGLLLIILFLLFILMIFILVSSAPQNFKVTDKTPTNLMLSWSPPEFILGEVLFYQLHFKNSTSSIKIPANLTSYIVRSKDLHFNKCSSTYSIYLTLKTKFSESLPSNVVQATTSVVGKFLLFTAS